MQFEGEDKIISLKGIERAGKDTVSADGAMNEVIGLIARDDSFVPYMPTDMGLNKMNGVLMVRVHHTSTGDNLILVREPDGITGSDGVKIEYADADTYRDNGYCTNNLTSSQATSVHGDDVSPQATSVRGTALFGEVKEIVFVGNRMDVETDAGIEHYLWQNGEYIRQTGGQNGDNYVLPSVDFKVRAGIYDGNKVHKVAQKIWIEKNYDETLNNAHACPRKQAEYVKKAGNMGNYALVLSSEIRHAGGITGYVLVAAAYHIKGTAGEKSEYIMASPVVLMGAPEIYQKDDAVRTANYSKDTVLPNKSYMLDILDYKSVLDKDRGSIALRAMDARNFTGISSQEASFGVLDKATEKDNTSVTYEGDDEFVGSDKTLLRTIGNNKAIGHYSESTSYPDTENVMYIPNSTTTEIRCPMLFGSKYAVYNHNNKIGTVDSAAEHYGICVLRGTGNVLSLRINGDIAEQYENEINELVVFMSPVISPFETKTSGDGKGTDIDMVSTLTTKEEKHNKYTIDTGVFFFDKKPANDNYKCVESACGGGFMPKMKSDEKLRKEIKAINNLYRMHTIAYKDIKKRGWIDIDLSGELENMTQNEPLPLSALRKVNIINGHIFGYNERLHIYNYNKSMVQRVEYSGIRYNGQASQGQYGVESDSTYHYAIVVTDKNGSKVVKAFDSTCAAINPIVSYPDTGAKRITVIKRFQRYGKYYAGKKDYTPEVFAGQFAAYYITKDLRPMNIETKKVSLTEYQNAIPEEQIMPDSLAYGKNEIRVSDVGLTTFPDSNSYKVGKGEIIGLARLTMGLSQDNFGRFPLVIFTTDGVYTMETDTTGAGAYTAQSPMSRMICTNKDSICELDGAVLFATEYGLMMLTSDGVKPVAHHTNGTPKTTIASEGLTMYRNAIRHEKITEMEDVVSDEDFVAYIQMKGTTIRYIHTLNMVVIYNPLMAYSYMMELSEFVVTKVEKQITMDDQDYPKQTFYLQEKIRTRLRIVRTRNGAEETIDVEQATETIDVEALLRVYLSAQVDEELTILMNDNGTLLEQAQQNVDYIIEKEKEYEAKDESWFYTNLGKSKAEALAEVAAEREAAETEADAYEAKDEQIREAKRAFDNGSEGADEKVEALGIKSVPTLLQEEKDGKADYTELRKQLKQEEMERAYGYIDEDIQQFPVGRMVLEKQADGTWKWGKSIVTTTALNGVGFFPATDMPTGDRYVIDVENTQPVAVQFDYNVPEGNVQCLLQSRPIKLDSTQLKSAYRVVVRGTFEKGDDISVESKNGSTFNITNRDKLLRYCQAGTTLYFKSKLVHVGNRPGTTVWYWEDAVGNEVELNKYGIELATSVEKKSDTLTLSIREHYAGLYVFGSLDGEHWMPIGGTEKLLSYNRFHDIGVRTHRVSVKYMLVVFTGYLSTDSHIDGMEITTETRYNDKLK